LEKRLGAALISAYDANPAPIKELRRFYVEEEKWCPYCSANLIKKLDHYLPKSIYPEFALLDHNLVPCCSDCNETKGKTTDRYQYVFLNPLIHELPDIPILKARLDMAKAEDGVPAVSFYIDETTGADPGMVRLVKSHCEKLGLTAPENGIYVLKAVQYLSEELRNIKRSYDREKKEEGEAKGQGDGL